MASAHGVPSKLKKRYMLAGTQYIIQPNREHKVIKIHKFTLCQMRSKFSTPQVVLVKYPFHLKMLESNITNSKKY